MGMKHKDRYSALILSKCTSISVTKHKDLCFSSKSSTSELL